MELTAQELWNRILEAARPVLPEQAFRTWLSSSKGIALGDGTLVVEVASRFHMEIVEERYGDILEELAHRITGRPMAVSLQAAARETMERSGFPDVELFPQTPAVEPAAVGGQPSASRRPDRPNNLNPRYSFERFVVGSHNQLASAACRAVADKPGLMYNPLFLYGGVGLGKTHLMHAIGNQIREQQPDARIMYVSSETFTNDFVNSIRNGKGAEFRRRYREMDLLLVDDVQFLEGKEGTQEEFFHTFNALYDNAKQIILTSDRPPKEIPGLEQRLISRFEWGLVADVRAPDYETRVAILRKKAGDDGLVLDDQVMDFIAYACKDSVRELEGAIIKLLAYSSLTNQEVTVELARAALAETLGRALETSRPSRGVVPEQIKNAVAESWGVRPDALASKRRTKDLTVPRQVAMHLMKELLDLSLVQIGHQFGGRDHSTVIHSIRKVQDQMGTDPVFRDQVQGVHRRILGE